MAFHIVTISSLLHLQCCTGMHWEWGMGNGEWGMGNGEWGMGSGEWGGYNIGRSIFRYQRRPSYSTP